MNRQRLGYGWRAAPVEVLSVSYAEEDHVPDLLLFLMPLILVAEALLPAGPGEP